MSEKKNGAGVDMGYLQDGDFCWHHSGLLDRPWACMFVKWSRKSGDAMIRRARVDAKGNYTGDYGSIRTVSLEFLWPAEVGKPITSDADDYLRNYSEIREARKRAKSA